MTLFYSTGFQHVNIYPSEKHYLQKMPPFCVMPPEVLALWSRRPCLYVRKVTSYNLHFAPKTACINMRHKTIYQYPQIFNLSLYNSVK